MALYTDLSPQDVRGDELLHSAPIEPLTLEPLRHGGDHVADAPLHRGAGRLVEERADPLLVGRRRRCGEARDRHRPEGGGQREDGDERATAQCFHLSLPGVRPGERSFHASGRGRAS